MDTGERLAAYLADELGVEDRAELEAQLARDPQLRARLDAIARSDGVLASLPDVDPPPGFRARLDERLDRELAAGAGSGAVVGDALAARRARRSRALRPLLTAAAVAAVVAAVGVSAGALLRGAGDDAGPTTAAAPEAEFGAAADAGGPSISPVVTDNDYDDQELARLAVGVDVSAIVPPGLTAEEAQPLADLLQGQLLGGPAVAAQESRASGAGGGDELDAAARAGSADAGAVAEDVPAHERCLPQLLDDAPDPLVPVHVELARYRGESAVIYVFASPDPETGTYQRIEVWAVARADCHILSYAPYDRG